MLPVIIDLRILMTNARTGAGANIAPFGKLDKTACCSFPSCGKERFGDIFSEYFVCSKNCLEGTTNNNLKLRGSWPYSPQVGFALNPIYFEQHAEPNERKANGSMFAYIFVSQVWLLN